MTRLPAPAHLIEKAEGVEYVIDPVCGNPACSLAADDPHHIVRRSFIIGDVWWVKIEGFTVGNVVGLCRACHDLVTTDKERIVWESGAGSAAFTWRGVPLNPHPPTKGFTPTVVLGGPHNAITCKRCRGSGKEPAKEKPEWTQDQDAKPKEVLAVRIPKAELAWGHSAITGMIAKAGERLQEDLGFDAKTPPYYIISAVFHDWLEEIRRG